MRLARAVTIVGICSLAVPAVGEAQRDFSGVVITVTHIAGGVYMLEGSGGNIGLHVGDDGAFVVDDQFAPLTDKIVAAIREITSQDVQFVINTHWHGDHTGGNEAMGKAGALIVAHENVRKRMNPAEFKDLIGNSNQAPPAALPVVTFTEMVTFHWNDETMHIIHVEPAHTDGDAIVHFVDANVFHMGDLFFNGRYPFIDVNSGGNADGVIAAANRTLEYVNAETKLIPGHGDLATPDDLRAYRDMLVAVRSNVEQLVRQGMSADEVVAAAPTAEFDEEWAAGRDPSGFVRAMYQAVAGN